jgi:hypothetical protein
MNRGGTGVARRSRATTVRRGGRAGGRAVGLALAAMLAAACGVPPEPPPDTRPQPLGTTLPPLAHADGWGVPVLAMARSPAGALWVGTNGHGLRVLRPRTREWEAVRADVGRADGLSWDVVNSLALRGENTIWYGTVGRGFGVSGDGGATWRNWTSDQIGPRWQYVTPNGIRTRGDTVYIATGSGLRLSGDQGATWRCVTGPEPTPAGEPSDGCTERIAGLPTSYVLSLDVSPRGVIWIGHLAGLSYSTDGGRSWQAAAGPADAPLQRVRAVAVLRDSVTVWAATETGLFVDSTRSRTFRPAELRLHGWGELPGSPRAIIPSPGVLPPVIPLSYGMAASEGGYDNYRIYYLAAGDVYRPAADVWTALWWGPPMWPLGGASTGINRVLAGESPITEIVGAGFVVQPEAPRRPWLDRPILEADGNPYIDATQRHGETWGGRRPVQRGVALNTPRGTPVRAIGDGVVVFAGRAADGSNAVAVRHAPPAPGRALHSVYHHLAAVHSAVGETVQAGATVGTAGSTGGAPTDRVRVELHLTETDDVAQVVGADLTAPLFTVNPQLRLRPLPGTGVVAGRVLDGNGVPVPGARIHGFVLDHPAETPHAFVETYGAGVRPHPDYDENFAIGDVRAGDYLAGVDIDGQRVWRRVRVAEGQVTFVEFRP